LSGIVLDHHETVPTAEACADMIEAHPGLDLKRIEESRSLTQDKLATSDYRPQAALFAELHGGTPGINMLGDEWSLYGIAGISFRLTLFDFNRKKELLAQGRIQQKQIQFEAKRYKEQLLMRIDMLFRQIEALRRQESGNQKLVELADQFLAHQERLWQENQASHTDYLTALEHLTQQQSRLDQIHWQIERLKGEINFTLARVKGE
jgi:outer membrane protein TolC